MFHWTAAAIRILTWKTLDGERAGVIAARLGCCQHTVRAMQAELRLRRPQRHRWWTGQEKIVVRQAYGDTETAKIAKKLKRTPGQIYQMAAKLGLKKSHDFLSALAKKKLPKAGAATRFKYGMTPWNKGMRHPKGWAPGRTAETRF